MTIRIVLADNDQRMRDSMYALIDKQPGMEVVGEAENGRTLLQLAGSFKPDVVVMDISMSDLNCIDATRQMISDASGIKILALSMHSNRQFVNEMIKVGACGYLLKDYAFEELVRAIQTIADDRIYLCPGIENSAAPESG